MKETASETETHNETASEKERHTVKETASKTE